MNSSGSIPSLTHTPPTPQGMTGLQSNAICLVGAFWGITNPKAADLQEAANLQEGKWGCVQGVNNVA